VALRIPFGILLVALVLPSSIRARQGPLIQFEPADFVLVGAAGALWVAPIALGFEPGLPSCLPCPREGVPFFDRFAIGEEITSIDITSTILLLGIYAGVGLDLWRRPETGFPHAAAAGESVLLATGITEVLKNAIGRPRPVIYSDGATALADPARERRSLPSGHATGAFAAVTSYLLSRDGAISTEERLAVLGAAVVIGTLRVAASSHFPSDVLAGAAVGIGTAYLVHEIKF
jgi:membrane-associated phospholipid phosphatase